jgi:hypothetical protein
LAASDVTGSITNPGANVANYSSGVAWDSAIGNVSTVGSAGATSFYGTYDQTGNVVERNETILSGFTRVVRGGFFLSSEDGLRATNPAGNDAANESFGGSFRFASVLEPSGSLLMLLGTAALLARRRWKSTL